MASCVSAMALQVRVECYTLYIYEYMVIYRHESKRSRDATVVSRSYKTFIYIVHKNKYILIIRHRPIWIVRCYSICIGCLEFLRIVKLQLRQGRYQQLRLSQSYLNTILV